MALVLYFLHAPADQAATLSLFRKVFNLADQLRVHDFPSTTPTQKPAGAALPAARATTAPVELRDRWAKDRQGNEAPWANADSHTAAIWKLENKTKYLRVTWQGGRDGYLNANCFDKDLWPLLDAAKESGKQCTFYTVTSGKYLNLVGIRA